MSKWAELYRMVMPDHLCPYGLKSKDLLERNNFNVDDHHLRSREETAVQAASSAAGRSFAT
jgi:glutaredoxin